MAAPSAPRILCPHDGATLLDRRASIPIRWSAFVDPDVGATATVDAVATAVLETGGTGLWTAPTRLLTGDGTQGNMASAASRGLQSTVGWEAFTWGATATNVVADISVVVSAAGSWPDNPGYPGDARVRFLVGYGDAEIARLDSMSPTEYVGGGAAVPVDSVSIHAWLREQLGYRYTVAQAEALLGAVTGFRPHLRVYVQSYEGGEGYVTTWYAGRINLRLTHCTIEPDYQRWYQAQVTDSADTGFAAVEYDSGQVLDHIGDAYRHWLAPEALSEGDKIARVKVWDQGGTPSAWSASSAFSLAPDLASQMAHGLRGYRLLVELELARRFGALAWVKCASNLWDGIVGNVYRHVIDTASELMSGAFIRDWIVDGVRAGMVEKSTNFLVTAVGQWALDVLGFRSGDPQVEPMTLYAIMPDGLSPSCTGLSRGAGVSALVVLPCSDGAVVSGPRNSTPYLPLVVGSPTFGRSVDDFTAGRRTTVSGGLSFRNISTEADDSDPDAGIRMRRPLFLQILASSAPTGVEPQLAASNASVVIKALPDGALYSEALTLFSGGLAHEDGNLLTDNVVRFKLSPRTTLAVQSRLAANTIAAARFGGHLGTGSEGATIGETFGSGWKNLPARLVDVGEAGVRPAKLLVTGLSAVSMVLEGGVETLRAKTFDAATQLVTFTAMTAADLAAIAAISTWTVHGDGIEIDDYTGTPDADLRSGAFFLYLLGRMGIATSSINVPAFEALDDPALGGVAYQVRAHFGAETLVREVLAQLEQTRLVYVVERGDRIDVVDMYPTDVDAHFTILDETDIDGTVSYSLETAHMARTPVVEYNGQPDALTQVARVAAPDFDTESIWLEQSTRTVKTYHATDAGAEWVRDSMPFHEPHLAASLALRRPHNLLQVGSTVALRLPLALDVTGQLGTGRLWQIRAVDGRKLTLRRAALLPLRKRIA